MPSCPIMTILREQLGQISDAIIAPGKRETNGRPTGTADGRSAREHQVDERFRRLPRIWPKSRTTGSTSKGDGRSGGLERAKGFEPSTPTLARSCSTTELHPHPCRRRSPRRQRADLCQKRRPNATGLRHPDPDNIFQVPGLIGPGCRYGAAGPANRGHLSLQDRSRVPDTIGVRRILPSPGNRLKFGGRPPLR
jgi:hypothetical protein